MAVRRVACRAMSQQPDPYRHDARQPPPQRWDAAGRPIADPRAPVTSGPPSGTSIEAYRPPRQTAGWWILAGVGIVIALIAAGLAFGPRLLAQPTTEPTSATPSPTRTSGQPFATSDGRISGSWEVLESRWDEDGLHVRMRIGLDQGTMSAVIDAFSNEDLTLVEAQFGAEQPSLDPDRISAGEERIGWVSFPVIRSDTTIILSTRANRQLSGITVSG